MKNSNDDRLSNKKVTPNALGKLSGECIVWYLEAKKKFATLSLSDTTILHGHTVKYVSLVMSKNPSLNDAYDIVSQIAKILVMPNPFTSFCTRKSWDKYLGYKHVANLTFLPLVNDFSPFQNLFKTGLVNVFDPMIYERQIRLIDYAQILHEKCVIVEHSSHVSEIITSFFEQNFDMTRILVEQIENKLFLGSSLFSSSFMDVDHVENQMNGIFNAFVNTWFQLEICQSMKK